MKQVLRQTNNPRRWTLSEARLTFGPEPTRTAIRVARS